MTWTPKRRGWFNKSAPRSVPVASIGPIRVPNIPCFSLLAIAALVGKTRQGVEYWISSGKMASFQDNIGDFYVEKDEVVRFIRQYLHREIE